MDVSLCVARPWPVARIRVLVVVAVFVIVLRWVPDAALPLGLGVWLDNWLAGPAPGAQSFTTGSA